MLNEEIHVMKCNDEMSGIDFTIAFDNLDECIEFLRFYNRPIKVGWIEPVYSFDMDPILEKRKVID